MKPPYFIGVDVGTQGARVVLIDIEGSIIGRQEQVFPLSEQFMEEQEPEDWWQACLQSLERLVNEVKTTVDLHQVKAMAVTSTSGTVIPLGKENKPLHPAIMYSDKRSVQEGKRCRELALQYHPAGYTGFNSSSGLSKMVWFVNTYPHQAAVIARWVHAADYITGKLSGCWGITDDTNALKSGFDLDSRTWPAYLSETLPLQKKWFPEVVSSGTPVGTISNSLSAMLGLPGTVQVVAGITDGCASQIASGAVNPGAWNTTIGTTLVVKGVTRQPLRDAGDTLYNHRHPQGFWMPGGASNIGADWITRDFTENLDELNAAACKYIPTGKLVYPLRQRGERFPFMAPQAEGFSPQGLSTAEKFAAGMEGVAYIERYAYEMIEQLSGEAVNAVYTAGGGSNSDVWLTIRSNVLNKVICKMKHVSGDMGAAILAASQTHFSSVTEAVQALTQTEKKIVPDPQLTVSYQDMYTKFVEELAARGYILKEQHA